MAGLPRGQTWTARIISRRVDADHVQDGAVFLRQPLQLVDRPRAVVKGLQERASNYGFFGRKNCRPGPRACNRSKRRTSKSTTEESSRASLPPSSDRRRLRRTLERNDDSCSPVSLRSTSLFCAAPRCLTDWCVWRASRSRSSLVEPMCPARRAATEKAKRSLCWQRALC